MPRKTGTTGVPQPVTIIRDINFVATTPQRQSRAPTPWRAPTPVAYAPPTPNTANLSSTRLQTVEDLLDHINQVVASTNANVHTVLNKCNNLDNSYTEIVNRFECLFEAQDSKFESLEKQLTFLRDQNKELKDKILNLPQTRPTPVGYSGS